MLWHSVIFYNIEILKELKYHDFFIHIIISFFENQSRNIHMDSTQQLLFGTRHIFANFDIQ